MSMIVGVCRLSLMIEESQSLKDKRSVLRRIKDRVSQKFNCAIAEVGDPDVWQSAQLGFAVVSNERGFTQSMVQKILQFIDDLAIAKLVDDEQDYVEYGEGDLEGSSRGEYSHWEPDEPGPPRPGRSVVKPPQKLSATSYPWDAPEPVDSASSPAPGTDAATRAREADPPSQSPSAAAGPATRGSEQP